MSLEPAKDFGDYVKAVEHTREMAQAAHDQLDPKTGPMWVVFGPDTADQQGMFVARLWSSLPLAHTSVLIRAGSLDEIREMLPTGLARLERYPGDDPNIIEVWMHPNLVAMIRELRNG
jgi:hypothetical protein